MTNERTLYNVVVLVYWSILKLPYHNKNLPRLVMCPIRDEIRTAALISTWIRYQRTIQTCIRCTKSITDIDTLAHPGYSAENNPTMVTVVPCMSRAAGGPPLLHKHKLDCLELKPAGRKPE